MKEIVRCPTCGSSDVVYTCEPKCCFNHLCAECRTTFELGTRKSGKSSGSLPGISVAEPLSGEPSVACAACESLRLAALNPESGGELVCGDCGALLELQYENVCPES